MKLYVLVTALAGLALGLVAPDLSRPVLVAADGTRYTAGHVILKLAAPVRGEVVLTRQDGTALFGVPALDEPGRRWGVDCIAPLYRRPDPDPLARAHGCDLQFLVQFDPAFDARRVAAAYDSLAEVDYSCLNEWLPLAREPNDTAFARQWHLPRIGAPRAWDYVRGDSSVLIGVLDNGTEWHHPDIGPNLWVNAAEDLNDNGRFDSLPPPEGDLDGVDQDSNGTTDDVIGWDFMSSDPNPDPSPTSDNHGTHCWGIANGITDNTEGIAGVPWNCRSFAYRCGALGLINISAAVSALYHCVGEGGWVISMSFGSYSPNPTLRDACAYAWDAGLALVAGAGNDGTSSRFYPSDFPNVVSVAASGPNDTKPSWSNYGDWIEVAAPGDNIYSTVPGHGYGPASGTSMATPVVAGALAWIKSAFPSVSNAEAYGRLYAACDSMPDDYYRNGQLGHGRISLANVILPEHHCDLRLDGWRFNDPNGNGQPDPGETAALIVTYRNSDGWRDAAGVSAVLSCGNPEVELLKPTADFPDIPAGATGDCSADSFVIRIVPGAPPQHLCLGLTATATPEPAWPDAFLNTPCGDPRVLIVDDNGGADYERWYTGACDSNSVRYDVHDVLASGTPPAESLLRYPVVVWFCGDDSTTTLTAAEQASLTAYLDSGGNLMISGQNIAEDLAAGGFLSDYLRAELAEPSTGMPFLAGTPGDPVTRGDTMVAAGGGGAANGSSLDGVRPVGGGTNAARFRDHPDTTVGCIVRYHGDYRLVYFSVPFEAIDHATSLYLQKWTLIRRVLEYFGECIPGVTGPGPGPILPDPAGIRVTPCPVRSLATVEYLTPEAGNVRLGIYSADGRLVVTQVGETTTGRGRLRFDASGLPAGVYLIRLNTPAGVTESKTVVLR